MNKEGLESQSHLPRKPRSVFQEFEDVPYALAFTSKVVE